MRSKILPFTPRSGASPRGNTNDKGTAQEPARITSGQMRPPSQVAFHRTELALIHNVYGQMVSQGDWKDYAMDFLKDRAIFSVYRRASEHALYRIEKTPALKAKQGQYSVIAQGGLILKRGHDLKTVLRVFDKQRFRIAD